MVTTAGCRSQSVLNGSTPWEIKSIPDFTTEHMQASRKQNRYAEEDRARTKTQGRGEVAEKAKRSL